MPNTRIKICGITRPQDAALAAELGADAIGLNFVGGPRRVTPLLGRAICAVIPPLVWPVLLTRGSEIANAVYEISADFPEPAYVLYQVYDVLAIQEAYYSEPLYWPVFSIGQRTDISRLVIALQDARKKVNAAAILLDTASPQLGGTGQSFNWNWIAEARDAGELDGLPPIILAGGLTPDNVAEAIRIAKPYAVDVSSGVEVPGKPGTKDPIKLRDFIQAAKAAL